MFRDTKLIYEVSAWKDSENPQCPDFTEQFKSKKEAMRCGRLESSAYPLVEVISIRVDSNDENNLLGEEALLSVWKRGKKTA